MKNPRYRHLTIEQRMVADSPVSLESWRVVCSIYDVSKPGDVLRSHHYRRTSDEASMMVAIHGEAYPVRVRARRTGGEDILTPGDVLRIGRALYAVENGD